MASLGKKLNVLVAIDEMEAPVWERLAQQVTPVFARDGLSAYQALRSQSFDLVLLDLYLTGMDSLSLLRQIRTEQLCRSIVLTSETPSFTYAQQGILNGVCAYLLRPLQEEELQTVIRTIRSEHSPQSALMGQMAVQAVGSLRNEGAEDVFASLGEHLVSLVADPVEQSLRWRDLFAETLRHTYQQYRWLRLYFHPDEFTRPDFLRDRDDQMVEHFCRRKIKLLSGLITELYPVCGNSRMDEVLSYLLQAIDRNVQQKEVAEQFYITNSTLSTRFQTQLGISYREYMTRIKIRRAEYLLRHTNVRIRDLAGRLGYKDRDYFSKLFLQRTGMTLQEYARESTANHYCI